MDQSDPPFGVEKFLRWEGGGDFRWELVKGQAVRLPRDGTRDHMRTIMDMARQFWTGLDDTKFGTATSIFAVRTPDGVRMPDIVIDTAIGGKGNDLAATAPVLIGEVLSPWSHDRDFGEKLLDYQGIASLRHYIVLSQDEPKVWHWSRPLNGQWSGPAIHQGESFYLEALCLMVFTGPRVHPAENQDLQ
jgi:Uma2 family endonuclease